MPGNMLSGVPGDERILFPFGPTKGMAPRREGLLIRGWEVRVLPGACCQSTTYGIPGTERLEKVTKTMAVLRVLRARLRIRLSS